jgi:hypothetical protein
MKTFSSFAPISLLERFMLSLNRRRRAAGFLLLLSLAPLAAGCYGRFPLTKAVYRFNGEVSSNKWIRSILFWCFIIIPVYEIAQLGDAIIFNLIEFWTGESLNIGQTIEKDGKTIALTGSPDGLEATLTVSENDRVIAQQKFTRISETTFEVRDSAGALRGYVESDAAGGLKFQDIAGTTLGQLSAAEIEAAKAM